MRERLDLDLIAAHLTDDPLAGSVTLADDEMTCAHCHVTIYGADAG